MSRITKKQTQKRERERNTNNDKKRLVKNKAIRRHEEAHDHFIFKLKNPSK